MFMAVVDLFNKTRKREMFHQTAHLLCSLKLEYAFMSDKMDLTVLEANKQKTKCYATNTVLLYVSVYSRFKLMCFKNNIIRATASIFV